MITFVKRKQIRDLINDNDDSFWSYDPTTLGAGKKMGDKFIRKIQDRINYLLTNNNAKFETWQETTDMFPNDSAIDYEIDWVLTVDTEKGLISIEFSNARYQKAVMIPFSDCGSYE